MLSEQDLGAFSDQERLEWDSPAKGIILLVAPMVGLALCDFSAGLLLAGILEPLLLRVKQKACRLAPSKPARASSRSMPKSRSKPLVSNFQRPSHREAQSHGQLLILWQEVRPHVLLPVAAALGKRQPAKTKSSNGPRMTVASSQERAVSPKPKPSVLAPKTVKNSRTCSQTTSVLH